ncbi:MAG: flagellar hook basal-body protein [Planctomycetota bacterium]|nr:flagellar hook basal-body protein [Planctomycetota bacterium]
MSGRSPPSYVRHALRSAGCVKEDEGPRTDWHYVRVLCIDAILRRILRQRVPMPKGIYAAASAMVTECRLLEATARNLAHVQTPGYRREGLTRIGFAAVLAAEGRRGGLAGDGGAGVLPGASYRSFRDGVREPTQREFDVALHGPGFFALQDPQGKTWLTRAGAFQLDAQGRLIDPRGWQVLGDNGPIVVPAEAAGSIVIAEDGQISVETRVPGGIQRTELGRLRIVGVDDPARMSSGDGIVFDPGSQTLRPATARVLQGHLERANAEPLEELVQLIALQRRYDTAQRALTQQMRTGEGYSEILRT